MKNSLYLCTINQLKQIKMKKIVIITLLVISMLLVMFSLSSCEKGDEPVPTPVELTPMPKPNGITIGDTLWFKDTITYNCKVSDGDKMCDTIIFWKYCLGDCDTTYTETDTAYWKTLH